MNDVRQTIGQIVSAVPRTATHIVWRLALYYRYGTSFINAGRKPVRKWKELAAGFSQKSRPASFAHHVLSRLKMHQGYKDETFCIFSCPPDKLTQQTDLLTLAEECSIISKQTLEQ